jgi:phospholipid-binding lipoprotein MlaA
VNKNQAAHLSIRFALSCMVAASLSACATTGTHEQVKDPLERVNRWTYKFNDTVDRAVLYPLASAYRDGVPQFVRVRVANFFGNLYSPIVIANDLLQGKVNQAGSDTSRLILNSVFGVAGLFDVATSWGHQRHDEDFGQTLGVWGVGPGWYIVWPFLGPSTARDSVGWLADYQIDPVWYLDDLSLRYSLAGLRVIDERSRLPSPEKIEEISIDPYLFTREAYIQRRLNLIYDGRPPRLEPPEGNGGSGAEGAPAGEAEHQAQQPAK